MKELLDQDKLFLSGVVANNMMNRARKCTGTNSYQKELSFDLLDFLLTKVRVTGDQSNSDHKNTNKHQIDEKIDEKSKTANQFRKRESVDWLDICWGEGHALIEAA